MLCLHQPLLGGHLRDADVRARREALLVQDLGALVLALLCRGVLYTVVRRQYERQIFPGLELHHRPPDRDTFPAGGSYALLPEPVVLQAGKDPQEPEDYAAVQGGAAHRFGGPKAALHHHLHGGLLRVHNLWVATLGGERVEDGHRRERVA